MISVNPINLLSSCRRGTRVGAAVAAVCAATVILPAQTRRAPTFYHDDPVTTAVASKDASNVESRELSLYYDAIINLFGRPGK